MPLLRCGGGDNDTCKWISDRRWSFPITSTGLRRLLTVSLRGKGHGLWRQSWYLWPQTIHFASLGPNFLIYNKGKKGYHSADYTGCAVMKRDSIHPEALAVLSTRQAPISPTVITYPSRSKETEIQQDQNNQTNEKLEASKCGFCARLWDSTSRVFLPLLPISELRIPFTLCSLYLCPRHY